MAQQQQRAIAIMDRRIKAIRSQVSELEHALKPDPAGGDPHEMFDPQPEFPELTGLLAGCEQPWVDIQVAFGLLDKKFNALTRGWAHHRKLASVALAKASIQEAVELRIKIEAMLEQEFHTIQAKFEQDKNITSTAAPPAKGSKRPLGGQVKRKARRQLADSDEEET